RGCAPCTCAERQKERGDEKVRGWGGREHDTSFADGELASVSRKGAYRISARFSASNRSTCLASMCAPLKPPRVDDLAWSRVGGGSRRARQRLRGSFRRASRCAWG